MTTALKGPIPWAGGKALVAAEVWTNLGSNCSVAVDPFFGGGSLLWCRPGTRRAGDTEIANDLDGFVVNFWRALAYHPDELAAWLDYPVSEQDLHARHRWLRSEGRARLAALNQSADPFACDVPVAAWWAWGQAQWIGGGWCGTTAKRRPKLTLNGVCRRVDLPSWMEALAERLRHVAIWHGDWTRCVTDAVTNPPHKSARVAVLLDPPYDQAHRHHRASSPLYTTDTNPAAEVRAWCLANGHRPHLRIALFGLAGEGHEDLEAHGWVVRGWTARGMSNQGHDTPSKTRRHEERVWFSPACELRDTPRLRAPEQQLQLL
jgi:DNA adenine methylase